MKFRTGTAYFVSLDMAAVYYRNYDEDRNGYRAARIKLREGSIHIGPPPLKHGQKLTVIDNGTRYAIEE